MIKYLLMGAGFAFAAAVQPGPLQAFLFNQALTRGWRRALPAIFGPLLSDAPIIVITLVVLSRVPDHLVRFLHLFGAGFLFFLTWGAYRSWRNASEVRSQDTGPAHQTLFKSALVNFLNPNPWLGWSLVMGPLFLQGLGESAVNGWALIVGFYVTMIGCLAVMIVLVAQAGRLGPRFTRVTLGFSVLALGLFGCYQLWLGLG